MIDAKSINAFILSQYEGERREEVAHEIQEALDRLVAYVSNREGVQSENDPPDGQVTNCVVRELESMADYGFSESVNEFLIQGEDEGDPEKMVYPSDEEVEAFEGHMKATMYLTSDLLRALNGQPCIYGAEVE